MITTFVNSIHSLVKGITNNDSVEIGMHGNMNHSLEFIRIKENVSVMIKWILNSSLSVACLVHISFILYNYLHPQHPRHFEHDKHLSGVQFPLILKFCFDQENFSSKLFQSWGYETYNDFYRGISMYNTSMVGWYGHSGDGSHVAPVEGNDNIVLVY